MKTQSENKVTLVKKLHALIETRKIAEKEEKEIKAELKMIMGDDSTLEAGGLIVLRSERSRKDLDKDQLSEDMGQEFIAKYTKVSHYEIMEVKPIKLGKGE